MPQIVHVIGQLGFGGIERVILGLLRSSALSLYDQSVVCVHGARGETRAEFENLGVSPESCTIPWPESLNLGSYRLSRWIRRNFEFTFPWRLRRKLDVMGADLVHSHVPASIGQQARAMKLGRSLPWVWTIHGHYDPVGAEVDSWRTAASIASEIGTITAISRSVASSYLDVVRGHSVLPEVIYPGVEPIRTTRNDSDISSWRHQVGIPSDATVYGTSGRLVKLKGVDIAISALRLLDDPLAYLAIAGEGPERQPLEELARGLGVLDRCRFLGYQSDIERFLSEIDVFLHPSRKEGFGLAIVEALAMGKPCVASAIGGIPELLDRPGVGRLVSSDSPSALAGAMVELRSKETRRLASLEASGRAQMFTAEITAKAFGRVYGKLLNPRQRQAL